MSIVRKSLAIGAAAAAIAFTGGAAQAADFTVPLTLAGGVYNGNFGDSVSGTFNDAFSFTLPSLGGISTFTLSSSSVSMSSFISGFSGYLDTDVAANQFTILPLAPFFQFGGLAEPSLTSGSHTIHVTGTTSGASYSGTIAIEAVAGSAPEPATWAMMIGGFGLVGGALRRRALRTNVSLA